MKDHSWLFEVLHDLERYSEANDLENLRRTLEETIFAAKLDQGIAKIRNQHVIPFPKVGKIINS